MVNSMLTGDKEEEGRRGWRTGREAERHWPSLLLENTLKLFCSQVNGIVIGNEG